MPKQKVPLTGPPRWSPGPLVLQSEQRPSRERLSVTPFQPRDTLALSLSQPSRPTATEPGGNAGEHPERNSRGAAAQPHPALLTQPWAALRWTAPPAPRHGRGRSRRTRQGPRGQDQSGLGSPLTSAQPSNRRPPRPPNSNTSGPALPASSLATAPMTPPARRRRGVSVRGRAAALGASWGGQLRGAQRDGGAWGRLGGLALPLWGLPVPAGGGESVEMAAPVV